MSSGIHREFILPNPASKTEERTATSLGVTVTSDHVSWLELYRTRDASIQYLLGAPNESELGHTFHCLRESFPGAELGAELPCPLHESGNGETGVLRTIPIEGSHYWPMRRVGDSDRAGILVRSLKSREFDGRDVLLQVLFRRVPYWERNFLGSSYPEFIAGKERGIQPALHRRKSDPAYQVEMRVAVAGPRPESVADSLQAWLRSWTTINGNQWWTLEFLRGKKRTRFYQTFRDHDISRFGGKKARRDISANELVQVLPIPWRENHPGLHYAGAPSANPSTQLSIRSRQNTNGICVGHVGDEPVGLPSGWHHLAILGKTRSGKSTLAQNIVLQILEKEPNARVVVLEPTGNLIRNLVDCLPREVAEDTVEIDPSHPTFEQDGMEMAAVPLNLLHLNGRWTVGTSELERRAERLSGDLLQAIKNAWGEQSVGGRADFILRTVIQALLTLEGTNLVDAYSVLSDKEVLKRLERLSQGALLKNALRHHLPRLDYSITISSLDKVGKIATNPLLRKTLCQRYAPVSFDQVLQNRLLLLNLGKGALGTEASTFLGAIFLTQLWSALQERPAGGAPVYLVVDEFHNFAIPAFTDMLSEGARLGLHVVAITQYLNRIPDRIRSALLGNVGAWMLFPLGTEDMKEAFELVQGSRFGWQPDHLVGGLGPHQAAFSVPGTLMKLDTYAPPHGPPNFESNRDAVQISSHRYARPEDSEISPLGLSTKQVATYLRGIPGKEGIGHEQLADALGWPLALLDAATTLCNATGCVEEVQDRNGCRLALRMRGRYYLEALEAARNEGEDHCALLADTAAYLFHRGHQVQIVIQEGGYLRPDAEFEWRGRTYSVEAECSTLATHLEQVARNLRKALAQHRRVLVVVEDRQNAETFARVLAKEVPEAELWREVGLLWREGVESMVPCDFGSRKPWGFLPGGVDDETDYPDVEGPTRAAETTMAAVNDPRASDLARVYKRAQQLLVAGKWEATADDFKGVFENEELVDRVRLGMALETLGARAYRKRIAGGEKVKHYDLRPLAAAPIQDPNLESVNPEQAGREGRDRNHQASDGN